MLEAALGTVAVFCVIEISRYAIFTPDAWLRYNRYNYINQVLRDRGNG